MKYFVVYTKDGKILNFDKKCSYVDVYVLAKED